MNLRGRITAVAVGAATLGVVALAVGVAPTRPADDWRVITYTAQDRRADVDLTDGVALAASGTTTKTLMKGSCAVANLKTWWSGYDGPPQVDPYLEYKNSSWNVPGSCGDPYGNFQLQFNSNDGHLSGWFTLSNDETIFEDRDSTGPSTSKALLGYPCPVGPGWGYHQLVTAPWGTAGTLAAC